MPTPEPAKMPMRWPWQQGVNRSSARTPRSSRGPRPRRRSAATPAAPGSGRPRPRGSGGPPSSGRPKGSSTRPRQPRPGRSGPSRAERTRAPKPMPSSSSKGISCTPASSNADDLGQDRASRRRTRVPVVAALDQAGVADADQPAQAARRDERPRQRRTRPPTRSQAIALSDGTAHDVELIEGVMDRRSPRDPASGCSTAMSSATIMHFFVARFCNLWLYSGASRRALDAGRCNGAWQETQPALT